MTNQVNIHHFQGSFDRLDLHEVMNKVKQFVTDHTGQTLDWEPSRGLSGYQASFGLGDMVKVCYDTDPDYCEKIHNNRYFIIFRGEFFDHLPVKKLLGFSFLVNNVTATRFDAYVQDFNRVIEIPDIYELFKKNQCKGFRRGRLITSWGDGESTGDTLELGRRGSNGSGKFLRIYDKDKESNGEIKGIRWEVEYSNDRAVAGWDLLCRACFKPVNIAGMVLAASDWVEPSSADRRSKMKRLTWYQELIDSAELVTVPCPVKRTDIIVKDNWVRKQVSKSLSYIRLYLECAATYDFKTAIDDYCAVGFNSLKDSDLCQIINDLVELRKTSDSDFPIPSLSELQLVVNRHLYEDKVA